VTRTGTIPIPAGDLIRVEGQFYILANSSRIDERTQVLKEGETFAVLDRFGDIAPVGMGSLGLYHEGTRFLSFLSLRVGGERPLLLSSSVKSDNTLLVVDLSNPDIAVPGRDEVGLCRGTLHIAREFLLWRGVAYQRLRFVNYGSERVSTTVSLMFDADFADLFEVRGTRRPRRGEILEPVVTSDGLVLGYLGLDGVERHTRITCVPHPVSVGPTGVDIALSLGPREGITYTLTYACENGRAIERIPPFAEARSKAVARPREQRMTGCSIETANPQFDEWLRRSLSDLHLMLTETPHGLYPYAGVPWYSTPFGRDGIITALETLWMNPAIAHGVLSYLAATQASELVPLRDAQPGKILHEARLGEMATLGEVPFGRYYGTVDATPLFVMLAGAYYARTNDGEFLARLWPHVQRALQWIDRYGDADGDGFTEYQRQGPHGLVHQGWKDSHDSVFHADGTLAAGPIALCEVQGYVYAARRAAADMAKALGHEQQAHELLNAARDLRQRFEAAFWLEDLGTYALALDGAKMPCRIRTSNPGHCLYTGLVDRDRARRVMEQLMSETSFSGWGIRTVARTEARYNPMSYHNGSVWPHDNAIIAAGFARYGWTRPVFQILSALFSATQVVDLHRLPELFCGFDRRPNEAPTLYPVACSPQAWASATPFALLQSCLGLTISAADRRIDMERPQLPEFLPWLRIRNLPVGRDRLTLLLERNQREVSVHVERRTGSVEVRLIA
jgi:glycogen debranching enzyme